jgi:uncharacterized protein
MKRSEKRWARIRAVIVGAIFALYKSTISPAVHALSIVQGGCGYQPSCSEYATIAIAEHGVFRGGMMAAGRLLRCHPFHAGGFDPVPARRERLRVEQSGGAFS